MSQARIHLTFNHVRRKSQEGLRKVKIEDRAAVGIQRQVAALEPGLQADQPFQLRQQIIIAAQAVRARVPQ